MGKFNHRIKRNESTATPRHLIFYDTETKPIIQDKSITKHELKVGTGIYVRRPYGNHKYYENKVIYDDIDKFWDWVTGLAPKRQSLFLYAHNQSFDFSVMNGLNELPKRGFKIEQKVINDPGSKDYDPEKATYTKAGFIIDANIFVMKYRKDDRLINVLDSWNLEPISVFKMGEWIGRPKGEIDFNKCGMDELTEYCMNDSMIIRDFVLSALKFIDDHDFGYFKPTVANISFNGFRHRFMHTEIFPHDNEQVIKLERASYRGGRCDCYQLGKFHEGPYYYLDINKMYSKILRDCQLPYKLKGYYKNPELDALYENGELKTAIIHANITINEPVVPIRVDRLIFPVGTFNAYLTTPEIQYIMDLGKINKIYEMAVYDSDILFDKFVDYLTKISQNELGSYTTFEQKWAKRLLNSQYGRWGMDLEPYEMVEDIHENINSIEKYYNLDEHKWIYDIILNGIRYRKGETIEGRDSFVAIPSFVTSYARMMLWDYICRAGQRNLYYTDTDSLFVNQIGYDNLIPVIDQNKVGLLKVEDQTDYMNIVAPKYYEFGYNKRIKGIKHNATTTDQRTFNQINYLGLKSMLREGLKGGAYTKNVKKSVTGKYDKGIIGSDGVITPFELNEPIEGR